jgi:ArsR family transcriptional regulator, lead/cadmium/zinc/bismuth-responsive transcriptional repressor
MTATHIHNLEMDHCETHLVDRDRVLRAAHAMPESNQLHALVDAFRVLSNLTRLKIIHALTHEELCVCDIAALLDINESAVSRELRMLRSMHLVKHHRAGKCVYYTLDDDHVRQIFAAGLDHVCEQYTT